MDRLQITEGEWKEIRQATQRGRLIGRETFRKEVEAMTGQRLIREARGRPKRRWLALKKFSDRIFLRAGG